MLPDKNTTPQRGDKDTCAECGRKIMFVAGSWSHVSWPPGIKPDNCNQLNPKPAHALPVAITGGRG